MFSKDPISLVESAQTIGEPVFVMRGRDVISLVALKHYTGKAAKAGADPKFVDELMLIVRTFEQWQEQNKTRLKLPD